MSVDRQPIGSILLGTPALGANYLRCDGSAYDRADYPSLEAYMPDAYDVTQFMPNGVAYPAYDWSVVVTNGSTVIAFSVGMVARSTDLGLTWVSDGNRLVGTSATPVTILGAVWNGSIYCAVGSGPSVYTSTDGITWTYRQVGATNQLNDVAWNGTVFCAVESSSARAWTSPDGVTWTQRTMPSNTNWKSIAWSPSLVLFVAVSATAGTAAASSVDGTTWVARTITSAAYAKVAWANGIFAAVASSGTTASSSTNGTSWSSRTQISGSWAGLTWNDSAAKFIAVQAASSTTAMTSPDGINWSSQTMAHTLTCRSICSAGSGSPVVSVIVGTASLANAHNVQTTHDGVNYSGSVINNPPPSLTSTGGSVAVYYAGSYWFAFVFGSTLYFLSSDNGATWTSHTLPVAASITELTTSPIAYSQSLGLYVLALCSSQANVYSSTDAINWTSRAMPVTSSWFSIAWSGSVFVATSNTAANTNAAYSSNGTAWTGSTLPSSTTWGPVATDGTNFVTFPQGLSSAQVCARSTDGGQTWASVDTATLSAGTRNYTVYNGTVFLNVGTTINFFCQTSPTGATWTAHTLPTDFNFSPISLVANNGIFYLLLGTDLMNIIYCSTDGAAWSVLDLPNHQPFGVAGDGSNTLIVTPKAFTSTQVGAQWVRLTQDANRFRVPCTFVPVSTPTTRDSLLNSYYIRAA